MTRLTDKGEYIAPIEGSGICDEYDPAGVGAMDVDGFPQCAWCGWPKTFHAAFVKRGDQE